MSSQSSDLLLVGRIARAHGLKGECKLIPESDDPTRLLGLARVWIGPAPALAKRTAVDSVRVQQTKRGMILLVRLAGAQTRAAAEAYTGLDVYARVQDLPALRPGEFYLHDLVGMTVSTPEGDTIGAVKDVWEMPTSNIYVVERPGKKEALVPAVPAFVRRVDIERGSVVVSPIEGMLD